MLKGLQLPATASVGDISVSKMSAEIDFCLRVRITSNACEKVKYLGLHGGKLKNYIIDITSFTNPINIKTLSMNMDIFKVFFIRLLLLGF